MSIFSALLRKGSKVTVNGQSYTGNSISISNGQVIVDGEIQSQQLSYQVAVQVEGDVAQLATTTGDISVKGNVGAISTASGDVKCGSVGGNVQTVSGDVSAATIAGSVRTVSGDISH